MTVVEEVTAMERKKNERREMENEQVMMRDGSFGEDDVGRCFGEFV